MKTQYNNGKQTGIPLGFNQTKEEWKEMRDKKNFVGKTITRRFGKEYQLHGHIAD